MYGWGIHSSCTTMLGVIALAAYGIEQHNRAGVFGVVRHDHQVCLSVIESRCDDAINFAHLIFEIASLLSIKRLVHVYHYIVDVHDHLLFNPIFMGVSNHSLIISSHTNNFIYGLPDQD